MLLQVRTAAFKSQFSTSSIVRRLACSPMTKKCIGPCSIMSKSISSCTQCADQELQLVRIQSNEMKSNCILDPQRSGLASQERWSKVMFFLPRRCHTHSPKATVSMAAGDLESWNPTLSISVMCYTSYCIAWLSNLSSTSSLLCCINRKDWAQ